MVIIVTDPLFAGEAFRQVLRWAESLLIFAEVDASQAVGLGRHFTLTPKVPTI